MSDHASDTLTVPAATALLDAALARRAALLADLTRTDAVRLVHGSPDGLPYLSVDRYGVAFVVEQHSPRVPYWPLVWALGRVYGPDTPIFVKERWSRERVGRAGWQVHGVELEPDREVVEDGLRYAVRLAHEEHTGLFLDTRAARAELRARAEGLRVLNLFSYTGAFGVAAGAGGARSTTNVDLMSSALATARDNYRMNGVEHDSRTFYREDVLRFLRHARRGRGRWDVVVVDPPPTSRTRRGSTFNARRDYAKLIGMCTEVLAEGGRLLAGLNDLSVRDDELPGLLQAGVERADRVPGDMAAVPPQADFPMGGERPTGRFWWVETR